MALVEAAAAGLLVVSTKVGGVPEVLPPEVLLLADPSPEGLLDSVDEAIARVRQGDIVDKREELKKVYGWPQVTARTLKVYESAVHSPRDDSMVARLHRYYLCGKWFGKICVGVVVVDWLYMKWLDLWQPGATIQPAPELKLPFGRRGVDKEK